MVSVIFPAAGQGKRMKAGINKVFLEIDGQSVLVRTLQKFSLVPEVEEMIVVVGADEVASVADLLAKVPNLAKWKVIAGGSERQYSVWKGLKQSSPEAEVVLVHDAARPLIRQEIIEAVIAAAREYGSAVAAVPEKNTIKVVSKDGVVKSTPNRSELWAVQTPQGFRREILMEANRRAEKEGFLGTDDASLVERTGLPVHVVMSEYSNIKLTTPEDLFLAEAFLRHEQQAPEDEVREAAKRARNVLQGESVNSGKSTEGENS